MKSRHVAATHLLTVGEIADYLRVHPSTIYRLTERKELPPSRLGTNGALLWRKSTVGARKGEIRTLRHRN
jgi:excisionase family DNA binding protein